MPLFRSDGITEIDPDKIPTLPLEASGKFMRDDGTWQEAAGTPGPQGDKGDKGDPGDPANIVAHESTYDHGLLHSNSLDHSNRLDHSNSLDHAAGSDNQDLSGLQPKETGKGLSVNDLTTALKANYDGAYTHSQAAHAPSNAQKNSDITKEEIEAKLTGVISSHSHAGGAAGDIAMTCRASTSSQTITAGWSAYVPGGYEIGNGLTMEIGSNSVLELG